MAITVHGAPLSPFVRKVRTLLAEKGIGYQLEVVLPYAPPEGYEALNPLLRIPAYQDDDVTLADSAVICHYIEQTQPATPLIPDNAIDHARCEWLEKYADYELFEVTTNTLFRETLIKPLMKQPTDMEKINIALESKLPALLNYLEAQLGDKTWFVANQFSLADIAIACQFINMEHANYRLDGDRWPALSKFLQRCYERKSLCSLIDEERKQVDKILTLI